MSNSEELNSRTDRQGETRLLVRWLLGRSKGNTARKKQKSTETESSGRIEGPKIEHAQEYKDIRR